MSMNRCASMKWYSRPSTSLVRGFRVVWDTEKRSSGWLTLRMRLFNVVLPAPDGEERISRRKSSFDILHLLPHPLDFSLEFYDEVSNPQVLRFGSNRIYLAGHLLQKEIELPSYRLVVVQVRSHLLEMTRETYDLLGDVAALEQDHDFLFDPSGVADGALALGGRLENHDRDAREAIFQFSSLDLGQIRRPGVDASHPASGHVEAPLHVVGDALALGPAHEVEAFERSGESDANRLLGQIRVGGSRRRE